MKQFIVRAIGSYINLVSFFSEKKAASMASRMFSTPRKGKLRDDQIHILGSAFFEELEYQDQRIATYRWIGSNKTILLAHGWESNSARWHNLIKLLKEHNHSIIAIDAPAHGKSSGKEFNAILYSEYINRVGQKYNPDVIIGHSVGGMATIFSLRNEPIKSVQKIITLGSPAHFSGLYNRYVNLMGYNKKVVNAISELIKQRFGHYPDYFSVAKFSEQLNYPALIVHDKNDNVIPFEDALLLHGHYKGSELYVPENSGHSLNNASVNETLLHFISA